MPQLTQREGFAQFSSKPADINFNEFGVQMPDISQFNSSGQPFQIPQLPLTPTEMSGNPFHNLGGGVNSSFFANNDNIFSKIFGPGTLEYF